MKDTQRTPFHNGADLNDAEEIGPYYQILMNHSRDVILFIDHKDGHILEVNRAAVAAYGFSREQLLRMTIYDLRADVDGPTAAAQMAEADENSILFETVHRRIDGATFPVEVSSKGAKFGRRRILVSIIRDITTRKTAEEERERLYEKLYAEQRLEQRHRAELQAVMQNMTEGLVIFDAEGNLTDMNSAALAIHGFDSLDTLQRHISELDQVFELRDLDGNVLPIEKWPISRALRGETFGRYEVHVLRTDGSRQWIGSYGGTPVYDTNGSMALAVVTLRDVTDLKMAEEALRQSREELEERVQERTADLKRNKERLDTIVDNIPVMLTYFDASGKVVWLNREAERKIGLNLEEMQQTDLLAYCYPDSEYRREVLDYMQTAAPGWKDITMRVHHGEVLDSSWANVRLSDGSFIGIGIDVTNRKRAERQIEKYVAQLEWRNRELKDFADVAAHDLQEPLRKIQMFADLLLNELIAEFPETNRDYLNKIIAAAGRMRSLIRDLLAYSRLDSHSQPFAWVDLNRTVRDVLVDLSEDMRKNEGSVEVGNLPKIEADPTQMLQLFENLIDNALKFRKIEEKPIVKIHGRKIERAERHDRLCEIRIADNGIGFDEKYLNKIFEPFERLHAQEGYQGTGMGLSICRKIAERHGGKISARSTPGKGSTFYVLLPIRQIGRERRGS